MTEFNLDLGKKVLEQITLDPGSHHQSDPDSCVMGWAVRLDDKRMAWYCRGLTKDSGPRLLGISPRTGSFIYNCMSNRLARRILAYLVAKEERRRYLVAREAERADHRYQRDIDRQARAQVHAIYDLVEQEQKSRRSSARQLQKVL